MADPAAAPDAAPVMMAPAAAAAAVPPAMAAVPVPLTDGQIQFREEMACREAMSAAVKDGWADEAALRAAVETTSPMALKPRLLREMCQTGPGSTRAPRKKTSGHILRGGAYIFQCIAHSM